GVRAAGGVVVQVRSHEGEAALPLGLVAAVLRAALDARGDGPLAAVPDPWRGEAARVLARGGGGAGARGDGGAAPPRPPPGRAPAPARGPGRGAGRPARRRPAGRPAARRPAVRRPGVAGRGRLPRASSRGRAVPDRRRLAAGGDHGPSCAAAPARIPHVAPRA